MPSFSLLQTLEKRSDAQVGGEGRGRQFTRLHLAKTQVGMLVRFSHTQSEMLMHRSKQAVAHTHTGYKDTQFKLQYMMQIQTWLLAGHTRHGSILPQVKGSSDPECNHNDTSCEHVEESI